MRSTIVVIDRPVKLSFVSVNATPSAAGLSLVVRDADRKHSTFQAAEVLVVPAEVPGGAHKAGVQRLRFGLDQVDEALVGTGDAQRLSGNHGMLGRFAFGSAKSARLALAPRGGGWGGVARVALPAGHRAARQHPPGHRSRRPVRSPPHQRWIEPARRSAPRHARLAR